MSGHMPTHRHDLVAFRDSDRPGDQVRASRAGNPLPHIAIRLRKCGDWQWMKQTCKRTGWRDGPKRRCCWLCLANNSDCPYWDASGNAAWRGTVFRNVADWMAPGPQISGICGAPACVIWYCDVDWMHSSDLGPTVAIWGNIWYEVFASLGGTFKVLDKALGTLIEMHDAAAKGLGVDPVLHEFTIGMLKSQSASPP